MPATRQIQPMGFPGRLEAIRAPTMGQGKERQYRPQRCAYAPCTQLIGGRTGRVAICKARAARNKATERAASDQASHEVARVLIPLAPCSNACFLRSRHYSTVLPSPQRYGKRYEVEEWANQHRESDAQDRSQGINGVHRRAAPYRPCGRAVLLPGAPGGSRRPDTRRDRGVARADRYRSGDGGVGCGPAGSGVARPSGFTRT